MLIYHPAMDAYHGVFRILTILSNVDLIEVDKARILDFYILFPSALASARLPNTLRAGRGIAQLYSNPYRDAISPPVSFRAMADIQAAAIRCIAGSGLIELENLKHGFLKRTEMEISDALQQCIDLYVEENAPLADFLFRKLLDVPLLGQDGLKHRTSLMEYRYDYV